MTRLLITFSHCSFLILPLMLASPSNVVHVTSWLSRAGGGVPPVIWSLTREMQAAGVNCRVAGLQDEWSDQDIPASVPTVVAPVIGPSAFGYSRVLSQQLSSIPRTDTVIHMHGIWMHPGVVARNKARRIGCPLVISPHGMLEPWALQNSRWKKSIVAICFENRNLRSAHCLHALCTAEAENFRRYGLRNPIAIIPNGVDLFLASHAAVIGRSPASSTSSPKKLLFLSRLHPKKGLENLITVWRVLNGEFPDWQLIIAGSGSGDYERALKKLVVECQLEGRVQLVGAVYGERKRELLSAAHAFVLPSFSEGFSMAILEAAAAGLPTVLTRECNFPELARAGGAFEIGPNRQGIESGLRSLLNLPSKELASMGGKARDLVQTGFTWSAITQRMLHVYRWLLGHGPKPDCVV